jgi:hypothetical protein
MAASGTLSLMPEQPEPVTEAQVQELLRHIRKADGDALAFAFMHVMAHGDECRKVLQWQRTEGRARVAGGEDPEVIRVQTQARIDEARRMLHGKLVRLLGWAAARRPEEG